MPISQEREEKAGRADDALVHWRQATFLEPGQAAQLPREIAERIQSIPKLSLDGQWYPVRANLPDEITDGFRPDQRSLLHSQMRTALCNRFS